jgi:recombination protein RecA
MDKEIGEGTFTRDHKIREIDAISTGNLSIDLALGVGGIPKGRIVEIYGPESAGKSSLALSIVAQAQKNEKNKVVAYIDMEHALDPALAEGIGVDFKNLAFCQPDSAEQAMDITYKLAERGDVSLIVIDSVAALVPQDVIDKDSGQVTVGLIARLLTTALMKLNPISSKTNTTIIFINQLRDKIGTFGYGDKESTPGGRALKFYASVRIDLRKIGSISKSGESASADETKDVVGQRVKVSIKKNKVASPFKKVEVDLIFGRGFCYISDIFNIAVKNEIIKKGGAWFSYGEEKVGQGKIAAINNLVANPKLFKEIEEKVKNMVKENEKGIEEESASEEDILETNILSEEGDWK